MTPEPLTPSSAASARARTGSFAVVCTGALLLLSLALAGCGARHATLAGCLDAKGFLVQGHENVVRGSSPAGVTFTLTLYPSATAARRAFAARRTSSATLIRDALLDFSGNPPASPGGKPERLSPSALATIRSCVP